jgi:hypothetical protein
LREQIHSGKALPEQKMAVCTGSLPLASEDRVELLAVLSSDPDNALAERARTALLAVPVDHVVAAIARADARSYLFSYCADFLPDKPGVADALAKSSACPAETVTRVATHVTSEGIQSLLDNLDRFVSDSALFEAIANSPAATAEQKTLLAEISKGAANTTEMEEAAADLEPDPERRLSLMQRVSHMNVVQRLTLALKGGRSERMLLIHDPNKLVQRCVLQSPRLTDSEVEAFAAMTNISTEALRAISLTRLFMKNYTIVKNLVNNPKTPLDASLHLFPRLTSTDLLKLTTNKNIPETLRSSALKLHRKRKLGG